MNCKYMNMLRVVRGNAFKLKIAVEAYTPSGRRIDSFALGEAVLKLDKNGTLTTKDYTILEGTTILVAFDGSESLGVYGFQMSGEYEGEAWRWANAEIFQIVESNVKAHIPEGCVLLDDTYNMALKIVLSGGDGVTFTPSVSEQGIISWTNDGGLPNPEPRNIRGPRGEQGPQGEVGPQGPRGQMGLRGQIGPKGDKGDKGDTGATPVLDVTASVDENVGNPMVVVESFGPAERRTFDFQFKNLKGQKGETGATGPQGPQGQQGEPGNYTKPASGIPLSDLNGNVASGIVYDVTANNSGATFASLSALLSSGSLSTLIPTDVRKGGMQIRFVQSSDNKYVQFRYMPSDAATVATFTNVDNWQGVDDELTAGSENLVKSGTIYNVLHGDSTDDTISISITSGVGITQSGSLTPLRLVSGRKYKVTFGGDRDNGTLVALYLRANGSNTNLQFKQSDSKDGIDTATATTSFTAESNTSERWIMPLADVDNICFYASSSVVKDTGTLTYRFEWESSNKGIVGRIGILENTTTEIQESISDLGTSVSNIEGDLSGVEESLTNTNKDITDIYQTQKLDIFDSTVLTIAAKQGAGIVPTNTIKNLLIPKDSTLEISYVYDTGVYDGTEALAMYFNYTDGTYTSKTLSHGQPISITVSKDVENVSFYSGTAATANGTITISIQKVVEPEPEPEPEIDVPSYYFTDEYLTDKIDHIQSTIMSCAGNGDLFAFTTDEHWERNAKQSVPLIKYISENINLYKWISGGDSGHLTANIELGRLRRDSFKGKVLPAIGNHEYLGYHNYTILGVENKAAYAYFMPNDGFIGNILRGYYYWNDVERKIRYIVLSAFQPIEGEDGVVGSWGYEQEQLSWFTNTALAGVESGWNIIIITHSIVSYWKEDDVVVSYNMPPLARPFGEAMLRYNGNGNIVAVLVGHSHRDAIAIIDDGAAFISQNKTGKAIPVIMTTCDAYNFNDIPGEALVNRTLGTITEQAFDIDVVDFSNKKIHCIRIGAPANLTYQESGNLQERIVNYEKKTVSIGNTISLSSGLSGTVSWESHIPSVATVDSSGIVTGVTEGSTFVSAIDPTNNVSSTFIVNVTS